MSEKEEFQKRDLSALRFEVIDDVSRNKSIYEGDVKDIVGYLKKRGTDGLRVMGVDIDSFTSMEPISATNFLKWYELIVVPQFKSANYSNDLEFYFPDEHLDLVEEGE